MVVRLKYIVEPGPSLRYAHILIAGQLLPEGLYKATKLYLGATIS